MLVNLRKTHNKRPLMPLKIVAGRVRQVNNKDTHY